MILIGFGPPVDSTGDFSRIGLNDEIPLVGLARLALKHAGFQLRGSSDKTAWEADGLSWGVDIALADTLYGPRASRVGTRGPDGQSRARMSRRVAVLFALARLAACTARQSRLPCRTSRPTSRANALQRPPRTPDRARLSGLQDQSQLRNLT